MASDAHCHPRNLLSYDKDCEGKRLNYNIAVAANAWNEEEFLYNESLPHTVKCFGIHPQLCADKDFLPNGKLHNDIIYSQNKLILERRVQAIGEVGFDLFDAEYRASEETQNSVFESQLEFALIHNLPLILHIRRAMHKVFYYKRQLKKISAVIFHSYSGTYDEALSLLKNGINCYFSFGTPILLNHKKAIYAVSQLPEERILFETDAPFQPLAFKEYSTYTDIFDIINEAAKLRGAVKLTSKEELEYITDETFKKIYNYKTDE
jgi:TatD DNase family protein